MGLHTFCSQLRNKESVGAIVEGREVNNRVRVLNHPEWPPNQPLPVTIIYYYYVV